MQNKLLWCQVICNATCHSNKIVCKTSCHSNRINARNKSGVTETSAYCFIQTKIRNIPTFQIWKVSISQTLCIFYYLSSTAKSSSSGCQTPPPPRRGRVTCKSWPTGLLCTSACEEGYRFPHGMTSRTYICSNGRWSPQTRIPDCVWMEIHCYVTEAWIRRLFFCCNTIIKLYIAAELRSDIVTSQVASLMIRCCCLLQTLLRLFFCSSQYFLKCCCKLFECFVLYNTSGNFFLRRIITCLLNLFYLFPVYFAFIDGCVNNIRI